MKISERRRLALRSVADFLARARPVLTECARCLHYEGKADAHAACIALAQEAHDLGERVLLAALPDGVVRYRDDEVGTVELERGGITLALPNETPDEVVDALFSIAESIGATPMRYTLRGLADMVDRPFRTEDPSIVRLRAPSCVLPPKAFEQFVGKPVLDLREGADAGAVIGEVSGYSVSNDGQLTVNVTLNREGVDVVPISAGYTAVGDECEDDPCDT